ncbi:S-layer protein [Candidatus Woesearchaeota archaeon]|nr:S-layer protein [Candidatus Woesearchaeota archaeon]
MEKSYLVKDDNGNLKYLPAMILENAESLSNISHPTRLKILELLLKKPMYPAELAKHMKLHEQKIYYHIKQLVKADVLEIVEKKEIRGTTAKKFSPKSTGFAISLSKDWANIKNLLEKKDEALSKFLDGFVKNNVFDSYFVVGSPDPHGPHKARARDGHHAIDLSLFFGGHCDVPKDFSVKLDTDINLDVEKNLIVVGGPVTNLICGEVNEALPAKFSDKKPWGIITQKDTYTDDTVGMIARVPNPKNPDYNIIIIAGIRFVGTKAAVLALTRHTKQVLSRFTGQKQFYAVVQGFDLDGDGKIDSVEVLE